ncbi:MAG: anti-sigma F factor antagonist [Clostridiales bacterium]|nr:anti-sigma F factor antagonist [Clostridiales bacterium]
MEVKLKLAGDTLVVRLQGELDHHAVTGLRSKIDTKLSQVNNVLFNFNEVGFMDSSGLGLVLGRYKLVSEKGGKVLACSLSPGVQRVFELSGLQTRIPVFATEREALNSV